ncbi:MAG: glycosyltransferase family 4 protein [Flavobacteriales bacterium]|nr:glycosyltransferase family 4 protein [Flavobacteriales bacterium]
MNNKILIIGLIWPEPRATAAGSRMIQLIEYFIDQGFELSFASAAAKSSLSYDFSGLALTCIDIELNNSGFDAVLKDLNPGMVVFDRFLTEEHYGWKVQENCPNAIRILDTEDLHFLRKSRELAVKKEVDDWRAFIQNDTAKREIASIYRCDLSLIISKFEYKLLEEDFKVDTSLLFYLPFMIDLPKEKTLAELPDFDNREHFMTIGNFMHQPNLDAIRYLYGRIWPLIRKELPGAKLDIYGAYIPDTIKQLHDPAKGFFVNGWIASKKDAFIKARVCLAPLRFGAGQKGKLLDSMVFGTPNITSSIGAEGMGTSEYWNGFIEDESEEYASKAIQLYQDKKLWIQAQKKGYDLLRQTFDKKYFESQFAKRLVLLREELEQHRKSNFIGSMLQHHQHQGTKYLSKWIETKNLLNNKIIE